MPDDQRRPYPFLPLPVAESAERGRPPGGGIKVARWGHGRQVARVRPQLQRLQDALQRRTLELRDDLAGVAPELALVIETAGSVQRFRDAVRKIRGLEWLSEEYEPEMDAGEDFHREGREGEPFGGTLYLVMTDQSALVQLLSLWRIFENDENSKFPTGLAPWRHAFNHIRTIRPWGPEDRLKWVLEDWKDRLKWGSPTVRAQVELWFRENASAREGQLQELEVRVQRSGGRLIGQAVVIPEIAYHACIVEIPRAQAEDIISGTEVELVRADGIMFFRPVGQIAVPIGDDEAADGIEAAEAIPPGQLQPVVALLDGLPLEGHRLLRDRLRIDDPDGWSAETSASERQHGTAMASMLVHGDLELTRALEPLSRPVYVRPVLRAVDGGPLGSIELIPEDVLEVDLIHQAVRRMLEGEGGGEPVAPETLIVSLSLGDPSRLFDQKVSPLARLIDWLAWKYGILFIVSAGNPSCAAELELSCSREKLRQIQSAELRQHSWQAVVRQGHLRRLLAPAESINALTIGGEHTDGAASFEVGNRLDPYGDQDGARLPSPVTAFGGGVGRSLKPDFLYPAGRQLYRDSLTTAAAGVTLERATVAAVSPGVRAATPGSAPGQLDRTRFTCGTSNATALASRAAAQLYERLPELLGLDSLALLPERRFLVPLMKALLVHDVSWGPSRDLLTELSADATAGNIDREKLGRFLGYGFSAGDRLFGCHEQRATLCGWGELGDGDAHVFRIPLPPSLVGERGRRRLTASLGWLSPINPGDRRYRRAHLWFEPRSEKGGMDTTSFLDVERCEADNRAAQRGTVQHEIFEGDRATVFSDDDELVIKVNCRAHAGGLADLVPYALVVSLEVAPSLGLPIYEEMKARVAPRAQIRP